jgi:hypothetical protein
LGDRGDGADFFSEERSLVVEDRWPLSVGAGFKSLLSVSSSAGFPISAGSTLSSFFGVSTVAAPLGESNVFVSSSDVVFEFSSGLSKSGSSSSASAVASLK